MTVDAKANWTGYPPFVTYSTASDLFGSNTSSLASFISKQIPAYASAIVQQSNNAYIPSTAEKQLRIQVDLIFNQSTPCLEAIMFPSNASVLAAFRGLLPFSRGSVHLSSTDASADPLINSNISMLDWDAILQIVGARMVRKAFHTAPLADYTEKDSVPTVKEVSKDAGVED
jgi:hypothetical protein